MWSFQNVQKTDCNICNPPKASISMTTFDWYCNLSLQKMIIKTIKRHQYHIYNKILFRILRSNSGYSEMRFQMCQSFADKKRCEGGGITITSFPVFLKSSISATLVGDSNKSSVSLKMENRKSFRTKNSANLGNIRWDIKTNSRQ